MAEHQNYGPPPGNTPQRIVNSTNNSQSHILAALSTPGSASQGDYQGGQQGGGGGPMRQQQQQHHMPVRTQPYPQGGQGLPQPSAPPPPMRTPMYQFQGGPPPPPQPNQAPPPGQVQHGGGGGGGPQPQASTMVRMLNTPARPPINGQVNTPANLPAGSRLQVVNQPPQPVPGSMHHVQQQMHHPAPAQSSSSSASAATNPANGPRIIDRSRIDDLVKQMAESAVLEEVVKGELVEYLDSFVDELVDRICRLVQHRGDKRLKASDAEFILEMFYQLPVTPRVGGEQRPTAQTQAAAAARNPALAAHKQRLALIGKNLKKL